MATTTTASSNVSEQMGHSSIKVTADLYGHLEPGASIHLIDRLEAQAEATQATNANPTQTPTRSDGDEVAEAVDRLGVPHILQDRYYTSITKPSHPGC